GESARRRVVDPVSALIMPVPANQELLGPAACERTISVFDGITRFDISLSYSGAQNIEARGYAGPVVVCAARYTPIAGHRPDSASTRYMSENQDIHVWLAPLPETRTVVGTRGHRHRPGARGETGVADDGHVLVQPFGHAVHFAQQHGRRVHRIARGIDAGFHAADGGVVHHLQRGGHDPARDDARHRPCGLLHGREVGEQRVDRVRERHQPHSDFGGDPEAPFAAHECAEEVVAILFGVGPAESRHRAIGEYHLALEDMIEGDAILEAVGAAGILGHVATDGARRLARGIRGVLQPETRGVA
ncbi:MAG: DUF3108 domain-containing protein, partial [Gemmatimonadaceae bacterium]|nr:DUF3108 domain-containing protein [Gemmatimonadaceae bacterium]